VPGGKNAKRTEEGELELAGRNFCGCDRAVGYNSGTR